MRAAVCPAHGPPEVIRIEERPDPFPEPGQAVVRVEAAAVNFPDVLLIAKPVPDQRAAAVRAGQ